MSLKSFEQPIVHQELALDTYLSSLLEEIPNESSVDDDSCEQEQNKAELSQKKEIVEIKAKPRADVQVKTVEQTELTVKPLLVMPDWAQKEFQAIFFKVDKLIFATPAIQILKVLKFEREPTRVSGQPPWFIGLLDTQEQRVGVLDTKQLVSGQDKKAQKSCEMQSYDNLLITLDGKWGLVCDEVLSIGKLMPETVRWRAMRNNRPWLIGMLIEELTTVIDVNYLVPKAIGNK